MSALRAQDIIADVRKVVVKRSLTDFLDAVVALEHSPSAPTQPYLVHLKAHQAGKLHPTRKAKVFFEDDVEKENLTADESLQQQKVAAKKKAVQLLESVGVELDSIEDVHNYFAAKSLIEWLPQNCLIPLVDPDYYNSAAFTATKQLEITTVAQEQLSTLSEAAAGFVAKVSRTKLCSRRIECLHHWGTHHAFQLLLRSALERRGVAAAEGTKLGRGIIELDKSARPLIPQGGIRFDRKKLLDGVLERTQLPHLVIPLLHLQCRGLLKDKKLLRDPHHSGAPSESESRAGSLSRTMSISSSISSGNGNAPRPTSSSSHSDTAKSAVSGMTSAGGRKAAKLQHLVFNEKLEYWIGLKGLVFRIDLEKCSPGRAMYYRAVLLPAYSGRECTIPFLALASNYNSWDFLGAKDRAVQMQRAGLPVAPSKPILSPIEGSLSLEMALTKEQKAHIDRIFSLFLADFDLIGELEGFEHFWF